MPVFYVEKDMAFTFRKIISTFHAFTGAKDGGEEPKMATTYTPPIYYG